MFGLVRKAALFLLLICICAQDCAAISAQGYALVESGTGRLVSGKNMNARLPMASTTKIMTGLLACESGQLDSVIAVPKEAVGVEGSSLHLVAGEEMTLRDLTYGLLLESGNDAANAIAYALEGSISGFAEKMNRRAAELGLNDTHFVNPSGLDDAAHYTSALDLARLGAFAMKNGEFAKIVSTYTARIPYNGIRDGRALCNHNELLKMYGGAIGIKTGYTRRSGRCLVSCAQRGGITLVAATLNGHEDFDDHITLLNRGFETLKTRPLFAGYPDVSLPVLFGASGLVTCGYDTDLNAVLTDDEAARVRYEIRMPGFALAPVAQGEKAGEIVFLLDDTVLARTDLLAEYSVALQKPAPGFLRELWNKLTGNAGPAPS